MRVPQPILVFHDFTGQASVPKYEVSPAQVGRDYRRLKRPRISRGNLTVTSWRLAHAVIKARHLYVDRLIGLHATGFILQNCGLFDWPGGELRLQTEMASSLADFQRSSTAGTVAQGVALLFMDESGYSFTSHFSTFATAQSRLAAYQVLRAQIMGAGRQREPDFVFQRTSNEVALVESKGCFIAVGASVSVKGQLRDGLEQIKAWMPIVNPAKTFVVATAFCDVDHPDRTELTFVDPEGDPEVGRPDPSEIRRYNYAAWLDAMGLRAAGIRLRSAIATELQEYTFGVISIDGREFAVMPYGLGLASAPETEFAREFYWHHKYWHHYSPWPYAPIGPMYIGVDRYILESLGPAALGDSENLMRVTGETRETIQSQGIVADGQPGYISVLSDGTLFGVGTNAPIIDEARIRL